MNNEKPNKTYYGKYRGTVLLNVDPEFRGRLILEVPDVYGPGIPSPLAEPSVPMAGPTGAPMGIFFVPPPQAGVWVEFEHGDPSLPVWTGCRRGAPSDLPPMALAGLPASPNIVLQTMGQNSFTISDLPGAGGFMLTTITGAGIIINETGIIIQNGQGASIVMAGPTITINEGALTIM